MTVCQPPLTFQKENQQVFMLKYPKRHLPFSFRYKSKNKPEPLLIFFQNPAIT